MLSVSFVAVDESRRVGDGTPELVNRLLDKGVVITGSVIIGIADIDLSLMTEGDEFGYSAAISGNSLSVASVGDSRAYLIHDGQMRLLTEDHSLVASYVRAGVMTAEEAACSKLRNPHTVITYDFDETTDWSLWVYPQQADGSLGAPTGGVALHPLDTNYPLGDPLERRGFVAGLDVELVGDLAVHGVEPGLE